jgi:osmotically-inducible protein OsmY
MTTATLTGSDVRLREAVIRQLDWDPEVDDSAVGVAAREGVVTLTGFIDTYAGKLAAERSTKHVRGVRAVANDLVVRLKVDRTDTDIATDAARWLKLWHGVPESVQAAVHAGHLTLTGRVESLTQRTLAEKAVRHVRGLKGVANHIEVMPAAMHRDVRRRIVQALHRNADLDARHVDVTVSEDTVTLTGTTASWQQREAAERAAGSAPGVRRVDNQITVVPGEPYELDDSGEIC